MSDILDSKGQPTIVRCVLPTGEEVLCESTERLEQVFSAYPCCILQFENKKEERKS